MRSGRIPRPMRTSSPSRTKLKKPTSVAVVADDRAQAVAARGVREQLDAPRVGRGVVPLVRELVPPLGDLRRVLLAQRLDVHGSEPTRATQRAAASSPRRAASSSEPPSRKPAASASPAPVVSTTSAATGARSSRASSVTTVAPRGAALDHAGRRGEVRAAEHLPLRLGREQHVGRDRVEQLAERAPARTRGSPSTRRRRPRCARRARARAAPRAAPRARSARAGARSRRGAGRRTSSHAASSSSGSNVGATPRSDAIERSPSAPTMETTTPVAPAATGPTSSTPRPASSRATSSPAASSPRFAMQRASAPSDAAQAATFAAWPPAPVRVAARTSSPGASGSSSRTITSSITSPRVAIRTGTIVPWTATTSSDGALVPHRRRRRRVRGARDRAPPARARAPRGASGMLHPAGPRRVRGGAVLPGAARAGGPPATGAYAGRAVRRGRLAAVEGAPAWLSAAARRRSHRVRPVLRREVLRQPRLRGR